MYQLVDQIENTRLKLGNEVDKKKRSELGQFMTPLNIARFMVSLFSFYSPQVCKVLDPGAGLGALSHAFLERWLSGKFSSNSIEITAFEIDEFFYKHLFQALPNCINHPNIQLDIVLGDFIEQAVTRYLPIQKRFTHAILNPPYKKINSTSQHRYLLRKVGIETVNLYSAFVALSLLLLVPGGQLIAIIPRSFCNGPYYRSFREFILTHTSLKQIHLFTARNKIFKSDNILQENIIIFLEKTKKQNEVMISTSTDDSFSDYDVHEYPFSRIICSDDLEKIIHIPTSKSKNSIELSSRIRYSLNDLNIEVSTGPVVDFRMREYLRDIPESGAVPLLYPGHFSKMSIKWPNFAFKKPNAIIQNNNTDKLLFPTGFYTVIKRFSSKEEKRRITASVINPKTLPAKKIAFENHLNVFHYCKRGLPELLAHGLAVFLNSTIVDQHFRQFNGHTQVNATDMRMLKYPSRSVLIKLGKLSKKTILNQLKIDELVENIL